MPTSHPHPTDQWWVGYQEQLVPLPPAVATIAFDLAAPTVMAMRTRVRWEPIVRGDGSPFAPWRTVSGALRLDAYLRPVRVAVELGPWSEEVSVVGLRTLERRLLRADAPVGAAVQDLGDSLLPALARAMHDAAPRPAHRRLHLVR